jgi:tRNA(fMet)-specific endonuclease VapC
VTIITVEEVLGGWYALIRQARGDERLEWAYHRLQQSVEFLARVRILAFTSAAILRYHELRKKHRRAGKNDLRIAAIVLEAGGTLVTRNVHDFEGIAGLKVEDWSS